MKKPHGVERRFQSVEILLSSCIFFPSMCSGMVETELGPSEVLRLKDDVVR